MVISLGHHKAEDTILLLKLWPLIEYTKVKSKWARDLNVSTKTIKVTEENKGTNLHDLSSDNGFLDMNQNQRKDKCNLIGM